MARPPDSVLQGDRRLADGPLSGLGRTTLRVTLGAVFLAHGVQKAVVWGVAGGVPFLRAAGIPLPELAAPLLTLLETLGGLALLVGYGSRAAALVLAFTMLVALFTVHLPHGFFLPDGGEYVLVLAAANLSIALGGPGPFALEAYLRSRRPGTGGPLTGRTPDRPP